MFKALVEMPGAFLSALIKCLPFSSSALKPHVLLLFQLAFSQDLVNQSEPSEEERKAAQSKLDDTWLCFFVQNCSVSKNPAPNAC